MASKQKATKATLIFRWALLALFLLLAWSGLALLRASTSARVAWQDLSYVQAHQSDLGTSTGRDDLAKRLTAASDHLTKAKSSLSSAYGVTLLRIIPGLDQEIVGTSQLLDDGKTVARAVVNLLHAASAVSGERRGTHVKLEALAQLDVAVKQATATFAAAQKDPDGLFGPVEKYRLLLNEKLASLSGSLRHADAALRLAAQVYGTHGPNSLLVLAQNNAEMRDQGCVLSYALLRGDRGALRLEKTGAIQELALRQAVNQPMSRGTAKVFGINQPTTMWQSVNDPGDFSWSAATAAKMYEEKTGVHVDMVVGADVVTIAGLLQALGPVTLSEPQVTVSSATVEELVLHQLYNAYARGDQQGRHDALAAIVEAVFSKLTTEQLNPAALASALAPSVAGRHLLVWSSRSTEEAAAVALGVSGRLDTVLPGRTFHLAVESAVAAKLDYYVDVDADYHVSVLENGDAWVKTTITETNHAPANQPPSYQLGPDHINSFRPGDYVSNTYLWVPKGARTQRGIDEGGLVLSAASLKVGPQQSNHFIVWTYLPHAVRDGSLVLHFIPQPRLRHQTLSVEVEGAGWMVKGNHVWSGPLAKSEILKFHMHR